MSRIRDLTVLPNLDTQPNSNVTATFTNYFLVPSGRRFLIKYLVLGLEADADFTTGDEDITFTIDYTLDGTTWVAVAAAAALGGTINGDQFLQYEPVTLPATVASQAISAMASSEIDFDIPGEAVVRVVGTIAGTTPDFQNIRVAPMGHFH